MFDFSETPPSRQVAAAARIVCAALGQELHAACDILGGPVACSRLSRLFDGLCHDRLSDAAVRRELTWLRALLGLDLVYDLESEEAARFGMLDPSSDEIIGLCQLHDVTDDLIASLPGPAA